MIKVFAQHKPSELGALKVSRLREAYSKLYATISEIVPDSREKSVALTHLETSAMWATKGVVHNDPQSVVE